MTSLDAPCIVSTEHLRREYFMDPNGNCWAFGVATVNTQKIKQLSTLPSLLEGLFVVELLSVEEQQVPTATRTCTSGNTPQTEAPWLLSMN